MMLNKLFKVVLLSVLVFSFSAKYIIGEVNASTKVMWGKTELIVGQIGKLTVLEETELVKINSDGSLSTVRMLKKGDEYRVYQYRGQHNGLYGVGSSSFVQKNNMKIKYETPSKNKLDVVNRDKVDSNRQGLPFTYLSHLKFMEPWYPLPKTIIASSMDTNPIHSSIREFDYNGGRYMIFENDENTRIYDIQKKEVSSGVGRIFDAKISGDLAVWNDKGTHFVIYNIPLKEKKRIAVPKGYTLKKSSISENGRYISLSLKKLNATFEDKRFVYDIEKKKMVELHYDQEGSNLARNWNGNELIYFGFTKTTQTEFGLKITIPSTGAVITNGKVAADPSFFSYNPETGEHKKLSVDIKSAPINYHVSNDWLVYEDAGVHLYNLKTDEQKNVITREFNNINSGRFITTGPHLAQVYFPTVNGDSVFFTKNGDFMKYDIVSEETTLFMKLPQAPVHEADPLYSTRHAYASGNYLFIYGNDVKFTVLKIK